MRTWIRIIKIKEKNRNKNENNYSGIHHDPSTRVYLAPIYIVHTIFGRFVAAFVAWESCSFRKETGSCYLSVRRARRHDKSLNFTVHSLWYPIHFIISLTHFDFTCPNPCYVYAATGKEEIANDKLTEIHIIFRSHFSHHRDTKKSCHAPSTISTFPIWKWWGTHSQFPCMQMHSDERFAAIGSKRTHTQCRSNEEDTNGISGMARDDGCRRRRCRRSWSVWIRLIN